MIGVVILGALSLVVLAIGELDRHQRSPRRFGIGLRRSHLHGSLRRPWRWVLHPMFSPDAIDVVVGTEHTTAVSGRARTYLGAWYAAARARAHLEHELETERAAFLADLRAGTDVTASRFLPEIPGEPV